MNEVDEILKARQSPELRETLEREAKIAAYEGELRARTARLESSVTCWQTFACLGWGAIASLVLTKLGLLNWLW